MKLIEKISHDYIPNERLINVDFFTYPDYAYMIYQYQRRNVVHCYAVKINGSGRLLSDPVELDTAAIGGSANNKVFTALTSEDKKRLIVFKINSKNKSLFRITTNLYDEELSKLKSSAMYLPMEERNDDLGEFALDNKGNLVFSKFYRRGNESISRAYVVIKKAMEDSLTYYPVSLEDSFLDEIRIKVDNYNDRYLISSFYYTQRRGSIEGLYFMAMDPGTLRETMSRKFEFNEDLRREARSESNVRMAFNDYFIRNITIKRDGGFLLDAESYFTTSRSSSWNRWDYIYGSPFMNPYDYYYYYSPYYSSWWWRRNPSNQSVRYHADNIVIFSFDKDGKLLWNNVIKKDQYDDETDDRISFQVMNTGDKLHYLFNIQERRSLLLNDFALSPGGEVNRNPTLKGLDKGHEFLTKYGKQVSARQFIVPCFFRNYICFAKVELN